jgi:hypothetical protein
LRRQLVRLITYELLSKKNTVFSWTSEWRSREDRELYHRLINQRIRLVFAEDVSVEHQHFHAFLTFLKKHFNYGRGSFLGYRNRGQGERRDKALEPLKFYWNLLFIPYPKHRFFNRVRFRILVFLTQLMTGLGFFWEFIGFVFRKDILG